MRDYSNNFLNYLLKLNIKSDFIYIDNHMIIKIKARFYNIMKNFHKKKKYNG